jgi:hypothetical protein
MPLNATVPRPPARAGEEITMKRLGIVLGLALACGLSARANYVIIRVITNNKAAAPATGSVGTPPGGVPMPGMPPMPGGPGGGRPSGAGSMPPMPGGPGGGRPSGAGGSGPGGGRPSGPGGMPPMPGGMPPAGAPAAPPIDLGPNDYVMAAIEVKNFKIFPNRYDPTVPNAFAWHTFGDKDSYALLFQDGRQIQYGTIKLDTPEEQYAKKNRAMVGAKRTPDEVLMLAEWCLSVGLVDRCRDCFEELVRRSDSKDVPPRVAKAVAAYRKLAEAMAADVPNVESGRLWSEQTGLQGRATSPHYYLIHPGAGTDEEKAQTAKRLALLENQFRTFFLWFAIKGRALDLPKEKLVAVVVADGIEFGKAQSELGVRNLVSDGFHAKRDNLLILAPKRTDEASRNFASLAGEVYQSHPKETLLKGKYPAKEIKAQAAHESWARAQTIALVDAALNEEAMRASISHEGTRQLLAGTGLLPRNVQLPEWLQFGLGALFETPKGPFPSETSQVKVAFWGGSGGVNWAWMRHWEELIAKNKMPDDALETLVNTISDTYFTLANEGKEEPGGTLKGGSGSPIPKLSAELVVPHQTGGRPSGPAGGSGPGGGRPSGPGGVPMPGGIPSGPGGIPSGPGDGGVPGIAPEAEKLDPIKLQAAATARARTFAWALTFYLAQHRFDELSTLFDELAHALATSR